MESNYAVQGVKWRSFFSSTGHVDNPCAHPNKTESVRFQLRWGDFVGLPNPVGLVHRGFWLVALKSENKEFGGF